MLAWLSVWRLAYGPADATAITKPHHRGCGVRCRLFAYGPGDANAMRKPHHHLPHLNPDWFYLSDTCLPSLSRQRPLDGCGSSISSDGQLPRILLMLELCMSGQALSMLRRSALAQTMNAFIGRFMCSRASATPPTTPPATPPGLVFDLAPPPPDDRGDLPS